MEKDFIRVSGFIAVKLMKEVMQWMLRVHHFIQGILQCFDLSLVQQLNIRQVSIFLKKLHLLLADAVWFPVRGCFGLVKKISNRAMEIGEVFHSMMNLGEKRRKDR